MAICSGVNPLMATKHTPRRAWLLWRKCTPFDLRFGYDAARREELMSAAASVSVGRDARVISLIGVAHGSSHYYQLAFVTMLLIVRDRHRL